MSDWIRSSTNSAYHKPANSGTAGNVTTVCKRIVPARYISDQDSVSAMDAAGYAFVCKDCLAKEMMMKTSEKMRTWIDPHKIPNWDDAVVLSELADEVAHLEATNAAMLEALQAVAEAGEPDIHGFCKDMHHAEQAARLTLRAIRKATE